MFWLDACGHVKGMVGKDRTESNLMRKSPHVLRSRFDRSEISAMFQKIGEQGEETVGDRGGLSL